MLRHVTALDGVRIACEVSGDGPPLVLVHGAGSARWTFALLRPHLEQSFTVIAVDRRGRGDSDDGAGGYELEREFDDVAAVLCDAGEGALLFGHSYGGLVAAGAASLVGGLPKLALYEPAMGGVLAAQTTIERWRGLIERGERAQAVREFLHAVGGYSHAEIEAMEADAVWEARLAVAPTIPRELEAERAHRLDPERLGTLAVPTLMLVGSESPEWARRSTEAYASALADAAVRRLDGHGHGAAVSGPALVAAELKRFLGA